MKKYKGVIIDLITFLVIYIAVMTTLDSFRNPRLTQMQVFLRIPKSFIWDFSVEKINAKHEKN